ncbi:MAG: protein kinase [Chloroflexales bacterium]|nr:protein kinase [Chloroflexales bacterium]
MAYSVHKTGEHNQPRAVTGMSMVEASANILCPICHKANLYRPKARYCQHCGHSIVLNDDPPTDHRRYYITRIIKQGGQGAVYAGRDVEGRIYAIKEMLDRFTNPKERAEAIDRFNEEAKLLQGLSHPRIPRVYSHFTDEGRHYLTMDFVQGEDLDQIVERHGPLLETQVLKWADQICDVLQYLHDRRLVYRDMKPSNVMIEHSTGNVKLVDFGIAKLLKPTERGTQIGTPGYAPPEQYQGFAMPASDIYALAATLHHVLTGRDPTTEAPFSFPPARNLNVKISRRTSDALEKALRMKPEDRFGTVTEFRAMLRPLSAQSSSFQQPSQVRVASQTIPVPSAIRPQAPVPSMPPRAVVQAQTASPPPVAVPHAPAQRQARKQRASKKAAPVNTPTVAPTQTKPAKRRRRGNWFVRFLMMILLGMVAGGGLWFFAPELVRQYIPYLPDIQLPQSLQTTPQLTTQQIALDVEALVPQDADNSVILAALRAEYEDQIKDQFGPSAVVNLSTVSTVGGGWLKVNEENGQARYRATMQGFAQTP